MNWFRSKLWGISVLELLIALSLLVVVISLFIPVYFNYERAKVDSWEGITYRVMDSMLPFQERYRDGQGHFAHGIFDRSTQSDSLKKLIGWKPSVTDSNRYVSHVIGKNVYKVTAESKTGDRLCRMYPAKQPCFDIKAHLPDEF